MQACVGCLLFQTDIVLKQYSYLSKHRPIFRTNRFLCFVITLVDCQSSQTSCVRISDFRAHSMQLVELLFVPFICMYLSVFLSKFVLEYYLMLDSDEIKSIIFRLSLGLHIQDDIYNVIKY